MTESEIFRYPTLFYVDGLPALCCTLAFWREHRGGPLERVLEVSS